MSILAKIATAVLIYVNRQPPGVHCSAVLALTCRDGTGFQPAATAALRPEGAEHAIVLCPTRRRFDLAWGLANAPSQSVSERSLADGIGAAVTNTGLRHVSLAPLSAGSLSVPAEYKARRAVGRVRG